MFYRHAESYSVLYVWGDIKYYFVPMNWNEEFQTLETNRSG
ncbi:hypothetical protein [Bacteroides salyersiae]|nr:hypothetical protein [Bacteroides salyersiae]